MDNNDGERSMLKEGSEFDYKRLFRFSAPALATSNMDDGTNWTLFRVARQPLLRFKSEVVGVTSMTAYRISNPLAS